MAEACVVCGREPSGVSPEGWRIFAGRMLLAIRVPFTPSILPQEVVEGVRTFGGLGPVQVVPDGEVTGPSIEEVAAATYRVCPECHAAPERREWGREEWLSFLSALPARPEGGV